MANPSPDKPRGTNGHEATNIEAHRIQKSVEPSRQYRKLLKGEISSKQFVTTLKRSARASRASRASTRARSARS